MRFLKLFLVALFMFNFHFLKAQSDFNMFEPRLVTSLSFNEDPFSIRIRGKQFNLPEIDIFKDPFSSRPEINMVEAASRKAYRAKQQQEQQFSFVERQSAMFSNFKPKIDNNSTSPWAPSYHNQSIYSDLHRVKNSAYKDLGDQYRFLSPFYQLSPYKRSSGTGFYFR
jgi:hypothetical protein